MSVITCRLRRPWKLLKLLKLSPSTGRRSDMNQLQAHDDRVLQLALMALTAIREKLDAGMTAEDQCQTICNHVRSEMFDHGQSPDHHREVKAILRKVAKTWPFYSGDPTCPVPAPVDFSPGESNLLPEEKIYERVFHGHLYDGSFWDLATEYGRMRADLLNHHIKVISDELSSRNVTQIT
ncbi:p49 [Xanthomonas phage Xop411]|uniref:p49 n=1 Tax=Xanthomonas phage Xop411 TaxID=2913975 RepID=A5H1J1_9CAUD|nr:p49 [Xanthomonas phage Xop411]ABK00195.1 p49 [Xanthomonas phage Xop411]